MPNWSESRAAIARVVSPAASCAPISASRAAPGAAPRSAAAPAAVSLGHPPTTIVTSPRVPAENFEASSRRLPRAASSCSFVSSRATQAGRSPRISAIRPSVAPTRRGDSNTTRVSGRSRQATSQASRSRARRGGKPAKAKLAVGRPATASAASTADGPGTASTAYPAAIAAATSLSPGSETSGVPASETSATRPPVASTPSTRAMRAASLCACNETGRALIPWRSSRMRVRRVSSASTSSASRSTRSARRVTSSRLPIGVATT